MSGSTAFYAWSLRWRSNGEYLDEKEEAKLTSIGLLSFQRHSYICDSDALRKTRARLHLSGYGSVLFSGPH